MKTYFIVSDIHAEYTKLMKALNKNGFEMENPNHIFVFGGDALDRGVEGDKVIKFLERLINSERIIGVIGNHDQFLLDLLRGDFSRVNFNTIRNGFGSTLELGESDKSIPLNKDSMTNIVIEIYKKYQVFVDWLRELPIFLEFNNHVLVHGFLDFSLKDWRETPLDYAVWKRGYDEEIPDWFEKTLIIGHTPNHLISNKYDIIRKNKMIMIDGGAVYGGKINVLKFLETEI